MGELCAENDRFTPTKKAHYPRRFQAVFCVKNPRESAKKTLPSFFMTLYYHKSPKLSSGADVSYIYMNCTKS